MSGAETFLARVVGALESAGVPYMLAGSFASSHHGVPRATQDIDIDPTFDALDRVLAALTGYDVYFDADVARDELKRRGQFNIIDGMTAWKVDLIFRKGRPFSRDEISRRVRALVSYENWPGIESLSRSSGSQSASFARGSLASGVPRGRAFAGVEIDHVRA
jgi:hypothetical protein